MSPTPFRLGICASPEDLTRVAPGYDFSELTVSTLIPFEDDAAWPEQRARLAGAVPPVRAFNVFVPGQLKLVGPERDADASSATSPRGAPRR